MNDQNDNKWANWNARLSRIAKTTILFLIIVFISANIGIFGMKLYYVFKFAYLDNLFITELANSAASLITAVAVCSACAFGAIKLVFWGFGEYLN